MALSREEVERMIRVLAEFEKRLRQALEELRATRRLPPMVQVFVFQAVHMIDRAGRALQQVLQFLGEEGPQ